MTADFDISALPCPRCAGPLSGPYYGPCETCRHDLGVTQRTDAVAVEAAAYEPKMNVTPNAVALKE